MSHDWWRITDEDNPLGLTPKQIERANGYMRNQYGKRSPRIKSKRELLDRIAEEYKSGEHFTVRDIDLSIIKNAIVCSRGLGQLLRRDKRFELVTPPGYGYMRTATSARYNVCMPSVWRVKKP